MQTLHYLINIIASKENVWRVMLGEESYKQWASRLSPGLHFEGSWEKGSGIKFLDADDNGMSSEVVENRLFDYIAVMHHTPIKSGIEQALNPVACPSFQEFRFSEKRGVTEVRVSIDAPDEERVRLDDLYPEALRGLKLLCETEKRMVKHQHQHQMV